MQTNNLIFLRHSKLVLPYRDHSEMPFSVLADLGTGKMNPPIDLMETAKRLTSLKEIIFFGSVRSITASPSQRCQDTAQELFKVCEKNGTSPEVSTSDLLKETAFDLNAMDTDGSIEKTFRENGIATINTAVFAGMVSGTCESVASASERVTTLFAEMPEDEELRIFITHDFFMRIIELYIRRRGQDAPISIDDFESTQRNSYLCGFATTRTLENFQSIVSDSSV